MSNIPQTSVANTQSIGIPGQLADMQSNADGVVDSATSEETTVAIPFGLCVRQGTADDGALILSANTQLLKGIAIHGHGFERLTELTSVGITPKTTFGLLKTGRVFVLPGETVAVTDAVRVQQVAEAGFPAGSFRKTASAGKSVDISKFARWLTAGTTTSPAKLWVDFSNVTLGVND